MTSRSFDSTRCCPSQPSNEPHSNAGAVGRVDDLTLLEPNADGENGIEHHVRKDPQPAHRLPDVLLRVATAADGRPTALLHWGLRRQIVDDPLAPKDPSVHGRALILHDWRDSSKATRVNLDTMRELGFAHGLSVNQSMEPCALLGCKIEVTHAAHGSLPKTSSRRERDQGGW